MQAKPTADIAVGMPASGLAQDQLPTVDEVGPSMRVGLLAERARAQLKDLCIIGWLFVAALLIVGINTSYQKTSERDFVYFFSVGRLLNEHSPEQLYDYQTQQQMYAQVQPLEHYFYGPSPYPPYVALFFRPFARLPFMTAYHLWMAATLVLYIVGLWCLMQRFLPNDYLYRSTWLCGAILFWPFLGRTFVNGQLAAVGFFAMSLALYEQSRGRYYRSGVALSLCLYKPTLLLWIIPLLLVARARKTLIGFFSVAAAIAIFTTLALGGPRIWLQYLDMTAHLGVWRRYLIGSDYVDVVAFFSLISRGIGARVGTWICFLVGTAIIIWIWQFCLTRPIPNRVVLAWAMTLPWSLIINLYTPVYDSVLLLVSLVVTAEAIRKTHPTLCLWLYGLTLVASYCTTWIAASYGVQVLTLLIAAAATLQVSVCRSQFQNELLYPPCPTRAHKF